MILRIISAVHGTLRNEPASAFRDFYLLSDEDVHQAPRLLPWSMLIQFPRDTRVEGIESVLHPLGLTEDRLFSVPSDKRMKTWPRPIVADEFPNDAAKIAVLIPAETRKKKGITEYRFLRPWAFSKTGVSSQGRLETTYNLRQNIKKLVAASAVWVILNGKPPMSVCSACENLWQATIGDCQFPQGRCFNNWRRHGA